MCMCETTICVYAKLLHVYVYEAKAIVHVYVNMYEATTVKRMKQFVQHLYMERFTISVDQCIIIYYLLYAMC